MENKLYLKDIFELIPFSSTVTIVDTMEDLVIVEKALLKDIPFVDVKDYLDCEVVSIDAIEPQYLEVQINCDIEE